MQRKTKQRTVIVDVFSQAERPLSPQEVLERAQQPLPQLGLATVYRAINDLLTEEHIVRVEVTGTTPLYERANLQHHHHFRCTKCGDVFDLQGCALDPAYRLPHGFEAESHEIVFSGTCETCD